MSQQRLGIALLLIALAATFVCFIPSLNNDFVNYDDHAYVIKNWMVKDISLSQTIEIFKAPQINGGYNPLTIVSLAIDYAIGDGDPLPFHVTNLTLHLLSVMLVFWFIQLLTKRVEAAFICALLFGIHPMHVEPVAWISSRKDVLYGFFFISALVSHVYYLTKSRKGLFYVFTFVLYSLSLLSKGVAVVLPVLLLLLDYLYERKDYWKAILEKVPYLLLSLGIGLLAIFSQVEGDAMMQVDEYPIFYTIFTGAYSLLWYLFSAIIPYKLSAYHPYPFIDIREMQWYFYAAVVPLIALLILSYIYGRKSRQFIFGIGFFVLSIAPVLKVLPFGIGMLSERYTYIPYIGLFYLLALAFVRIKDGEWTLPNWLKVALLVVGVSWVSIFGVMSYHRSDIWQNGETLWTDVAKKYPNDFFAYTCLGDYWQLQGDYMKSIQALNKSIEIYSNYTGTYHNRAKAYEYLKQYQLAFEDFNKAIELEPKNYKALLGRAITYMQLYNDIENSMTDLNTALMINPQYALAYLNRGVLYEMKGGYDLALKDYSKAISLEPNNATYYVYRANLYQGLKEPEKAKADELKAKALGYPNAYE